jgi:dsDNA-specific endonuclease/ATPase MutS2
VSDEAYNPFPEPVVIEITDVFDLHTIPPKQVKAVIEEYLHQAHVKGFPVVRIIHGKGSGVQREIVRKILSRTGFIDSWTDAPPDAGGLGATIVFLRV